MCVSFIYVRMVCFDIGTGVCVGALLSYSFGKNAYDETNRAKILMLDKAGLTPHKTQLQRSAPVWYHRAYFAAPQYGKYRPLTS